MRKPTPNGALKARSLYTPEPVRGRVVARHIDGQSNREIARGEGIDRETVSRILSQEEVAELKAAYRSRLLMMIPKAISAYDQVFDSDDLRLKAATATKVLAAMQVFPEGVEQVPFEPDARQRKLLVLGELMQMVLDKHHRYGMSLPPEIKALEGEYRKKTEPAN